MNKKVSVQKILTIVISVLIVSYLAYNAFAYSYSPIDTLKLTEKSDYEETFDFKGLVVRDEEIITDSYSGSVIPLVKDGKRVAKEDDIAVVCSNEEDAADFKELENARKELERYIALSNNAGIQELDAEKLNSEISSSYKEMMKHICDGVYDEIDESIVNFTEKNAIKQILSEGTIDVTEQISALEAKIKSLESKNLSYSRVTAPSSGYYINSADGYENSVDYNAITQMDLKQVEAAVESAPGEVPSGSLGKLVGSYRWYVIGTADSEYYDRFTGRKRINVNFPDSGIRNVVMDIESVKTEEDKIVIILSCDLMNETFANIRSETIEVVSASGTGYKVPVQAVRFDEENNPGIFVLRGKIINFIKVETLYSDGEYAIVDSPDDASDKITLYDDVIIKGKDIVDGNVIR